MDGVLKMGKYDGLILCSDIDYTLIDDDMQIPPVNLEALECFRAEGGKFTASTGRTLQGAMFYLDRLKTDVPMICQNGSAIYDQKTDKYIWLNPLNDGVQELVEYVKRNYPAAGIEIITPRGIYYHRENHATYLHQTNEDLSVIQIDDYSKIKEPWVKIVFADMPDKIDIMQAELEKTVFNEKYKLVRSHTIFYEAIEKNTNKGVALSELCKIMGYDYKNIIVAGDNDNDVDMLRSPALSFAPANALDRAKAAADVVLTIDNNAGILPEILNYIDKKRGL